MPIADRLRPVHSGGMNPGLVFTVLAFLGGAFMAVQAPTNALIGKATASPIAAALISFAVGTIALAGILAAGGWVRVTPELKSLPWYAWLGGLYGAFFVAVAAFGAPRIGVGALLTAAVAGQLVAALLLDHFGLLGLEKHPVNIARIAGLALVFVGAAIVRRG